MGFRLVFILMLALTLWGLPLFPIEVTYIANEGFLISSPQKKVLIDSLFKEGYGSYLVPSPKLINRMITAEPPFDTIDLILVTHTDEDHFDPSLTIKFLLNSSKTQLVCPQQAVKQLAEEASFKTIKSQIHEVQWEEGSFTQMEINGIPIKSLSLNHSEDPAKIKQKIGYIFSLAG